MINIRETLQVQQLTEEDKKSRHILGRLYGPIATSKESTRNGRKYNAELWEKALNDNLMDEKIKTKSLFLELGHPLDGREETDMTKVCACIPEMPKIVNGDLIAYVDILDTPNGKLLKTLCDYGFIPGISSRGSGDVDINNEVDPETFYLETFDIVALPAVKKARLTMCESLDNNKSLQTALTESIHQAEDKDKIIMQEALTNLDIKLNEEIKLEIDPEKIEDSDLDDRLLTEEEKVEDEVEEEKTSEVDVNKDEPKYTYTVGELVKEIQDYDKDLNIEFKPIEVEGKEYPVEMLKFDPTEDGKLVIEIGYSQEIGDNIEKAEENEETPVEEKPVEELKTEPEEVSDAEDDGLVDSLKEAIRQKETFEEEIKVLKNEKAVSDAEVKALKEDINKYKISLKKVYGIATKVGSLTKNVKTLQEELTIKDAKIKELEESHVQSLNESINRDNSKIKELNESLDSKEKEIEEITEQANSYKRKLTESVKIVNDYKTKCNDLFESYIKFRAEMLGVRVSDIKNKLDENWSIDQIESVCDTIQVEHVGSPAFFDKNTKVVINESVDPTEKDDWDWDGLFDLAGLKK